MEMQALKRPVNAKLTAYKRKPLQLLFVLSNCLMKKLAILELSSLMGGWAYPEECKKVQERVALMENDPNADWDQWLVDFDRYCAGV